MKAILTILAVAGSIFSQAAIHSVSNSPNFPAEYATIQEAADAASSGDTLLIHNTGIPYNTVTLTKQLHLFGSTSKPDQSAYIEAVIFESDVCSGSSLVALQINGIGTTVVDDQNYVGISIRRCHIGGLSFGVSFTSQYNNWLIEGCVFYKGGQFSIYINDNFAHMNNFVFRNNICYGYIHGMHFSSIHNNIFTATADSNVPLTGATSSTITNNVFYGCSTGLGGSGLQIMNNISYGGTGTSFPTGGNFVQNNLENVDPQLSNVPMNVTYNSSFDFSFLPGSPALGAGTESQDLGVFDGSGIFRTDCEPDIPVVRSVTLPGGNTVPAEGSFQITVHSVSHQ